MQQVNVFIETSSRFRGNVERKCGYVLSTQLRTGKETREHFGRVTGTYHQAILLTMVDALDHMTRSLMLSVNPVLYVAMRVDTAKRLILRMAAVCIVQKTAEG